MSRITRTTVVRPFNPERRQVASCLVLIYGGPLGRYIPLDRDSIRVGRSEECDLPLAQEDVSREHCVFWRREGCVVVEDNDSTNGTWVEDERVDGERPLKSGERIRAGGVILKFLEGSDLEAQYHEEIYRTIVLDGLTGLHSRRFLMEFLSREVSRTRRHFRPLSLVLVDVDHFKQVNDIHGHHSGDQVLRQIGVLLEQTTRREACAARLGGEEFAIVLPETDLEGARAYAERVRTAVELQDFEVQDGTTPLTVSLGVSELRAGEDAEWLLRAADARLYQAKDAGRNRVAG